MGGVGAGSSCHVSARSVEGTSRFREDPMSPAGDGVSWTSIWLSCVLHWCARNVQEVLVINNLEGSKTGRPTLASTCDPTGMVGKLYGVSLLAVITHEHAVSMYLLDKPAAIYPRYQRPFFCASVFSLILKKVRSYPQLSFITKHISLRLATSEPRTRYGR